jgi:hypothetical protein
MGPSYALREPFMPSVEQAEHSSSKMEKTKIDSISKKGGADSTKPKIMLFWQCYRLGPDILCAEDWESLQRWVAGDNTAEWPGAIR